MARRKSFTVQVHIDIEQRVAADGEHWQAIVDDALEVCGDPYGHLCGQTPDLKVSHVGEVHETVLDVLRLGAAVACNANRICLAAKGRLDLLLWPPADA